MKHKQYGFLEFLCVVCKFFSLSASRVLERLYLCRKYQERAMCCDKLNDELVLMES